MLAMFDEQEKGTCRCLLQVLYFILKPPQPSLSCWIKDADDDNGVASALPNPALLDGGHHERKIPVLPKLQVRA